MCTTCVFIFLISLFKHSHALLNQQGEYWCVCVDACKWMYLWLRIRYGASKYGLVLTVTKNQSYLLRRCASFGVVRWILWWCWWSVSCAKMALAYQWGNVFQAIQSAHVLPVRLVARHPAYHSSQLLGNLLLETRQGGAHWIGPHNTTTATTTTATTIIVRITFCRPKQNTDKHLMRVFI